jgi:succinyl-CoA synthetase beta subunit
LIYVAISVSAYFLFLINFSPLHSLQNTAGQPLKDVVIKAQVLSGGRGLGTFKNGFRGGVHMITKKGQAGELASQMLGQVGWSLSH